MIQHATRITNAPEGVTYAPIGNLAGDYTRAGFVWHFPSMATLADWAESQPAANDEVDAWAFGSCKSRTGLYRRLRTNRATPAHVATAERLASTIADTFTGNGDVYTSRRRRIVFSEEGFEPDICRFLHGEDACWCDSQTAAHAPCVRLGIDVSTGGSRPESVFFSTAAIAAAVADYLVSKGYGVEIVGCETGGTCGNARADGYWYAYTWPIKRRDEPLDLAAILAAGTPGMVREVGVVFARETTGVGNGSAALPSRALYADLGIDYAISTHSTIDSAGRIVLDATQSTADA